MASSNSSNAFPLSPALPLARNVRAVGIHGLDRRKHVMEGGALYR